MVVADILASTTCVRGFLPFQLPQDGERSFFRFRKGILCHERTQQLDKAMIVAMIATAKQVSYLYSLLYSMFVYRKVLAVLSNPSITCIVLEDNVSKNFDGKKKD